MLDLHPCKLSARTQCALPLVVIIQHCAESPAHQSNEVSCLRIMCGCRHVSQYSPSIMLWSIRAEECSRRGRQCLHRDRCNSGQRRCQAPSTRTLSEQSLSQGVLPRTHPRTGAVQRLSTMIGSGEASTTTHHGSCTFSKRGLTSSKIGASAGALADCESVSVLLPCPISHKLFLMPSLPFNFAI